MFEKIGKFAARFRYPIIVAWLALAIGTILFAPSLSDAAISDQSGYLPADEPSVVAARMATEYFPDQATASQAILVIHSPAGAIRGDEAQAYLADLTRWLEGDEAPEALGLVLSPVDPNLVERLTSTDGKVAMFSVGLEGSIEDPATVDALHQVQARLDAAPQGLAGYVTGSTAISLDYKDGVLDSFDSTTIITIVLVVIILLAIYRSLVAPIIPLLTIGAAFLVSRGIVGWLASLGWAVSSITEVVLVVLLFGAGTDYCLFLVSRFREFMADQGRAGSASGLESAQHTVGRVGETITSSAGTVIVGMVALSFADMKIFASTGPSLALGVGIGLLAGLTLTPALLAALGARAFWPGKPRRARHAGFWTKLAHWVTARPWLPLALAMVILTPLVIYGQGIPRSFDLLADLPDDMPSKAGFLLLSQSMGAGEMQPLDVILTDIPDARSPEGLAHIEEVTQRLLADEGVADVRSLTLPAGKADADVADLLRVDGQLSLMSDTIDELRAQVEDPAAAAEMLAEMETAGGQSPAAGFDTLRAYLDELGAAFPDLEDQADYQAARDSLAALEDALDEGRQRLLVSSQLTEAADLAAAAADEALAQGLTGAGTGLTSAAGLDEALGQFSAVRDYLAGLVEAHPALAGMDGYDEALTALDGIEAAAAEIQQSLLVSTQLDLVAGSIESMAAQLQDPAAMEALLAGGADASTAPVESLAVLETYLGEMATAQPALAEMTSFRAAREDLAAVQAEVENLLQARLLSYQLALVAAQMDEYAGALEENPLALMPQPGEPTAAEQMAILRGYLEGLGAAYPDLAATEDYGTALALVTEMEAGLQTIDLSRVGELIAGMQESLQTLSAAFAGMSATAAETLPDEVYTPQGEVSDMMAFAPDLAPLTGALSSAGEELAVAAAQAADDLPAATFVPQTLPDMEVLAGAGADPMASVTQSATALEEELGTLAGALRRLGAAAAAELPDATYLPSETLLADQAGFAVEPLLAEVDAFQASLDALADEMAGREDGFLIPTGLLAEGDSDELDQMLDAYSTPDGQAARLQVVLDDDPFSAEGMDAVARLRDQVSSASRGYVSGGTATNLDLQIVMDRDFGRVMLLVIGGILIVLVLLLRSLVAPVYMMLSILLSYGATMGVTRLVFGDMLGQGIAWFVPFLIFVVVVALGMDYNIFLMGRVKEEVARAGAGSGGPGNGTRAGIEHAVERTGGIITSAGIIMAGTFAAMMSSSLVGLVQLGFAVAFGVLLDTFVIRTTLVPALATLLGRWNWWPGKGPATRAREG